MEKGKVIRVKIGPNVKFNDNRDTITLMDPDVTIIDQVSYEARNVPDEGYTFIF